MSSYRESAELRIGLAEAIAELRRELARAREEGLNSPIRFATGEIEVELALEFGWTREGGGGVKLFSFLDLSGKAGASEKLGHKVKMRLTVAGGDNVISGPAEDPDAPPKSGG